MKTIERYVIIILMLTSRIAAAQTEISVRLVHCGLNVPTTIIEMTMVTGDSVAANIKTYKKEGIMESSCIVSIERFWQIVDLISDLSIAPVVNQVTGKRSMYVVDDGSSFGLTLCVGEDSFSMFMNHPQHGGEERGLGQFKVVCYEILKTVGLNPRRFGIKRVRNANLKRLQE